MEDKKTDNSIHATAEVPDRYRLLERALEAARIGVWELDIATDVCVRSMQHDRLFGYSTMLPQWGYAMLLKHIYSEDLPQVQELYKKAMLEGHFDVDARIVWPDKTVHWISSQGTVIYDDNGKPIRINGVTRDITQRKRAEEENRRAQAFLTSIVENIPDMIFVKDAKDLRFVRFNKAGEELLGYRREDLIGKNDYDFFPKDEADHFTAQDQQVLDDGGVVDIPEEPIKTRTQGIRILHTKKIPITVPTSNSQYLLGISEDITDRKRAEKQLAEERNLLRTLIDQLPDLIYLKDKQSRFVLVNKALERDFGVTSAEQIIGKSDHDFFPRAIADQFLADELRVLTAGIPLVNHVEVVQRQDGLQRWYMTTKVPWRDATGVIQGLIGIGRDVTALRQAEKALEEKNLELARSNSDLEQFAYAASHDLQEPLRMVSSYMQLLDKRYRDKLDVTAHEFIDFAVDGAKRMQILINDLLAYSRVGTKGKPFEPTDCNQVMESVIANLSVAIQESGGRVTFDALPTVLADRSQMTQLLQNLVSNGLKFHGTEKPLVHVSASRRKGEWLFAVKDNGIGIAHEHQDRIFVIFQRLHTLREYSGTGIGLALAKKIVERHHGRIWVGSEPNKGSTFYFTIPQSDR